MRGQRWMRRFDFDTEAVVRLAWRGVRPINVAAPVKYLRPEEGGVSHFRYGRDNTLLTWMHLRLMAASWPACRCSSAAASPAVRRSAAAVDRPTLAFPVLWDSCRRRSGARHWRARGSLPALPHRSGDVLKVHSRVGARVAATLAGSRFAQAPPSRCRASSARPRRAANKAGS
jgi:hypothetical protein